MDTKRMSSSLEQELDEIVRALDMPRGQLPVDAIHAARRYQDVIVPRLESLIQRAVQQAEEGQIPETSGYFLAFFLLIEFRAAEAFDTIVRAVSLPGELPMHLFGDAIHETLPLAVPTLANHRLDEVLALIRSRDLNDFVRWAFQEGLLRLVAAGLRSREEIVSHLRLVLTEVNENRDATAAIATVLSLYDLYPEEAYDDIKRAYDLDLIDDFMIGLQDFDDQLARGKDHALEALQKKRVSISDSIDDQKHRPARRPERPVPVRKRQEVQEVLWIGRTTGRMSDSRLAKPLAQQLAGCEVRAVGHREPCGLQQEPIRISDGSDGYPPAGSPAGLRCAGPRVTMRR